MPDTAEQEDIPPTKTKPQKPPSFRNDRLMGQFRADF
jgi:hypothetical protein